MELSIGNKIRVREPSDTLMNYCYKNLRFRNPEFVKKKRMGFYTGNTPEYLYLYEKNGDTLILPYGCLKVLEDMFIDPYCDRVESEFLAPKKVDFHCEVPLYDYQAEAVDGMEKVYCGILQSAAGSGKTQMGIALAARLGRKTLWLTHTKDLLSQSKQRAEQYMDSSLTGTITDGKVNIGKGITFATVQTMSCLDLPSFRNEWDVIIVDECHHVSGTPTSVTQYSRVLNNLAARHKYGLSATVHRSDGLIGATYALIGPVAHTVPDTEVSDRIVKVSVLPRFTGVERSKVYMNTDGTTNYQKFIEYLVSHRDRNRMIADDIILSLEAMCQTRSVKQIAFVRSRMPSAPIFPRTKLPRSLLNRCRAMAACFLHTIFSCGNSLKCAGTMASSSLQRKYSWHSGAQENAFPLTITLMTMHIPMALSWANRSAAGWFWAPLWHARTLLGAWKLLPTSSLWLVITCPAPRDWHPCVI